MSMYNQLFGTDPIASFLLKDVLDIDPAKIARFRDCYLNEDGTKVVIFTRTGGGNREEYESANKALAQYAGYVSDEDADGDSTYAYFYFEPAERFREGFKLMAPKYGRRPAIERFMVLVEKMKDLSCKDDPDVVRAMEVGRKLMEQLQGAIELQDATSNMDDPPDPVHFIEV